VQPARKRAPALTAYLDMGALPFCVFFRSATPNSRTSRGVDEAMLVKATRDMMHATAHELHCCFLSAVILRTFLRLGRGKRTLSEVRES
ncbi:MAG: hypothetical protein WBZ42_10355, partial [Halobacteriota archaeon]